jgi:hypothetical protein
VIAYLDADAQAVASAQGSSSSYSMTCYVPALYTKDGSAATTDGPFKECVKLLLGRFKARQIAAHRCCSIELATFAVIKQGIHEYSLMISNDVCTPSIQHDAVPV